MSVLVRHRCLQDTEVHQTTTKRLAGMLAPNANAVSCLLAKIHTKKMGVIFLIFFFVIKVLLLFQLLKLLNCNSFLSSELFYHSVVRSKKTAVVERQVEVQ